MKKHLHLLILGLLLISSGVIFAQPATTQSDLLCGPNTSCFRTEVLKAEKISEECTFYQFKVYYEGNCDHALSHYTVAIPCGQITNLSNSKNWKQEFGYDPKTKLTGFKIDNIPDFGETSLTSFLVSFKVCTDNEWCEEKLKCWQPVVAYKAATKVYYDTLDSFCPSPLVATLEKQNVSCFGVEDGSLSAVVSEGEEPFTYLWSTGDTTSSIADLPAGAYSVTIKDASGEELQLNSTITQPEEIIVAGTISNASCSGKPDGSIDISVSGGNGIYTYLWNTSASTQDLSAITAGTYTVVVKDSTGCSIQKSFIVTDSVQISIAATVSSPACSQANGSIDITVTGGTQPYTFVWSNGATTEDIQNLIPGAYKVTVTDANGCTAHLTYTLRENNTLKLNAIVKQTSCLDDASGAIDLIVIGGTAPYTFIWTPSGATTEDLSGLIAGIYKVTVTDSNGCTASLVVSVSRKTFQIGNVVVQPLCHGDSTGSITLNPIGAIPPFTYQWSNGGTGNSISGLAPGTYTVVVTDSTGCSRQVVFIISDPPALVASGAIGNTQCSAEGSFTIDLSVSGGKAPYTYVWSNGASTEDLDSLGSGTYTVTINDVNGCSLTKEFIITAGSSSWACLINQPDSIPACGSTGNVLSTSVTGATYQWAVQSSDNSWSIAQGGSTGSILYTAGGENSSATFTLTITKDGCSQTCSYTAATCSSDSTGGEDPGGPGGGGDGSCEECFDSSEEIISADGSCTTYKITVSTSGDCRNDLSHWVVAIPCGNVKNYSNSEGWKMVVGQDPKTGLYGLKVDDISGFGKTADSFTVTFTVCSENTSCSALLKTWDPLVSYKAGQCVAYDTLGENDSDEPDPVCAYPNPFREDIRFRWTCNEDDYVDLRIMDKWGKEIRQVYKGNVRKGQTYLFECSGADLRDDLYIYRLSSKRKTIHGKLLKGR